MLTEEEARDRILASVQRLGVRSLLLSEALNHFSAEAVSATLPLPGFDNSAMDGYAVRAQDTVGNTALPVTDEQPAGLDLHLSLFPRHAIRIFTGAPMPEGADAVIMQEDVTPTSDGKAIVCKEPVVIEENVRITGCDLCVGQRLIEPGDRLTPVRLSVLASQGLSQVKVAAPLRTTIITTGDELVEAGHPLQSGQIYNSNATLMAGMIGELGVHQIKSRHLRDDLGETSAALRELVLENDVIVLSGGVSVGDHDFIKPALQSLGITPNFWRVKVKPGKPLLYSKFERDGHSCHIFGLPGNPVSSFITFQLFVRPALLKMMGAADAHLSLLQVPAVTAQRLTNKGDRPHYLRGQIADGKFSTTGPQQSHALFSLSKANALLRMEPESVLEEGARVMVQLLP